MILFAERLTLITKTGPVSPATACLLQLSESRVAGRLAGPRQQEKIQHGPAAIINASQINKDQAAAYTSGTPVEEKNSICHRRMGPLLLSFPVSGMETGNFTSLINTSQPPPQPTLIWLHVPLSLHYAKHYIHFLPALFSILLHFTRPWEGLDKIQPLRLPLPSSPSPSCQLSHTEPQVLQRAQARLVITHTLPTPSLPVSTDF